MFLIIVALIAAVQAEEPFWRAKEKVYSKIQNREIIVSVKSETRKDGPKNQLSIKGGGQVDVPCAFAYETSKNYETFAMESGFVEKCKYDSSTQNMDATLSVFGYKSDIGVKILSEDQALKYEMLKGPFKGMKGDFKFLPTGNSKKCDIGLGGDFAYDKFPIPQMFLRFGMEVMLQRMAGRLRSYVEKEYSRRSEAQ